LFAPFPSGTFNVADIMFKAKSGFGSTQVTFHTAEPRMSMAQYMGTDVTRSLTGGTYTIYDKTPPSIAAISPTSGQTGVAVNSIVVVNFSKPMNQAATQNAFILTASPPVAGSFSWNGTGNEMTFTPAANLAFSTLYTAGLSTAAKDIYNTFMAAPYSSSFTTVKGLTSISVTPSPASKAKGLTQQFTATPNYSDGTHEPAVTITWSSSDSSKVTIYSNGLATAMGVTTSPVTITATSGAIQGSASMSVTAVVLTGIEVTPSTASKPKGLTQQFTITPTYSDGTHTPLPAITWSSSDTGKVTINSSGLATAAGVTTSTVTITATSGAIQGTAAMTVTPAELTGIEVSPANATIALGRTQQFAITPTYTDGTHTPIPAITWSSSDESKVTINSSGLSTAVEITTSPVTITVASGTFQSTANVTVTEKELTGITLDPTTASKPKGRTQQFTATPTYSDGTHTPMPAIAWSSSDISKVTINSSGLATAVGVTTSPVIITATFGDISGTASMSVTAAELIGVEITPATASRSLGHQSN
jgi:uncharacterized protein YjdB